MSDIKEKIRKTLSGESAVPAGKELEQDVDELKSEFEYGLARELLAKARVEDPANVWIVQQLALCTYKDQELVPSARFKDALLLLEEIGLRDAAAVTAKAIDPATLPETLALGGAVYKRKWEYDGQLEHLHEALYFYRSAWTQDNEQDMGYAGVNAAYVLDILASRAKIIAARSGSEPREANELQGQARALREDMLSVLLNAGRRNPDLEKKYSYLVTLAEIHFGLEQYDKAEPLLAQAHEAKHSEWERQTTFKQLVSLARLQGCESPEEGSELSSWHPSWQSLHAFLKENTDRALSCYRGKLGLALSGGGFRASLFHIGVLARLAEMDVLRYVEVLSTVSGGSIVGAHYYLEVQHLLNNKEDADITRADYREIVDRVCTRFLDGVQCNLRTRTLSNLLGNLKMIFSKEYSRSHRLGELYEKHLYQTIGKSDDNSAQGATADRQGPHTMPKLLVSPLENGKQTTTFKPKFSNWRRRAKVPVLLLNTTSLNSGHAWHFTARWLGEPPGLIGSEVDVNERYRRLWYTQAEKPEHREYRLGHAVAASACVPGLFEPLVIDRLYPNRTVRLVDGGVHDNQGVAGLLNEGCSFVLCSDASGQMKDQKNPSDGVLGVPLRANSILMDRVREAEYQGLRSRVDSGSLNGLFFIHLKKDLKPPPIDWKHDRENPTEPPQQVTGTTEYGVDKDLQKKLADIRTDLDSFTEVEAYSLMLSGYLMTETEFRNLDRQHRKNGEAGHWGDFDIDAPRSEWPFLQLESLLSSPPDSPDARRADLGRQLEAGSALFFKIWKLSPILRTLTKIGSIATAALLIALIIIYWDKVLEIPAVSVGGLILIIGLALLTVLIPLLKWLRPEQAMRGYLTKFTIAISGFLFSNLHLRLFDPLFIKRGRLKRLLNLK